MSNQTKFKHILLKLQKSIDFKSKKKTDRNYFSFLPHFGRNRHDGGRDCENRDDRDLQKNIYHEIFSPITLTILFNNLKCFRKNLDNCRY